MRVNDLSNRPRLPENHLHKTAPLLTHDQAGTLGALVDRHDNAINPPNPPSRTPFKPCGVISNLSTIFGLLNQINGGSGLLAARTGCRKRRALVVPVHQENSIQEHTIGEE